MEKTEPKRRTRYWNAWAVILTDGGNNPVWVESFKSRDRAIEEYTKHCRKLFKTAVSGMVADGCTLVECRSTTSGKCLRVVVNKIWKEGFENES